MCFLIGTESIFFLLIMINIRKVIGFVCKVNRVGTTCPSYGFQLDFCFTSPVRRRVAQAGQGISARTV